jgi:hypothetical protein
MITKLYISHSEEDEPLAQELARTLRAVNLESFSALYKKAQALSLAERSSKFCADSRQAS